MIRTIKSLVRAWKARRDRKFRERIDRVYFRHDGKGNRFIRGHLYAEIDERASCPGEISALGINKKDILSPGHEPGGPKDPQVVSHPAR